MIYAYIVFCYLCVLWVIFLAHALLSLYSRPAGFFDWQSIHDAQTQELPSVMVPMPMVEQATQPVRSVISRSYIPGEFLWKYLAEKKAMEKP